MRDDVTFPSGRETCAAWLYRPPSATGPVPLIVMAHGLGGLRTMRLDAYAERFAAAGYAALVFDYRHFGDSSGEPRELLAITKQLADYKAAVAYARQLPGIDASRIVLWGSSFSGGHVLVAAALDPTVAAVISQCPFTSGPASVRALGLKSLLKVAPKATADSVAALLRRPPVRVSLIGDPGSAALMTAPDAVPGYLAIRAPGTDPATTVAARIGARIGLYLPGLATRRVTCPTLLLVCDKDTVAPIGPTLRAGKHLRRGEVKRYPVGHFDVYLGEPFERSVTDMIGFLDRTVGARAAVAA